MAEELISAEEVIRALGGPSEIAKLCEISRSAVSQWKGNGIPKSQLKFLKAVRPGVFRQLSSAIRRGKEASDV
jgi:hypothetical protein